MGPYQGSLACQVLKKRAVSAGPESAAAKRSLSPMCNGSRATSPMIPVQRSGSESEIVVPVHNRIGEIEAVLDIDSDKTDQFDEIDASSLDWKKSAR
ncbi:MAG: hypothetical protein R6V76_07905 [Desulfobacterales bacterium]